MLKRVELTAERMISVCFRTFEFQNNTDYRGVISKSDYNNIADLLNNYLYW
jgi:hypothetical protein